MIFEEAVTPTPETTDTPIQGWNDFWYRVGRFFLDRDSNGISVLMRIILAVIVIIIGFFLVKLLTFALKRLLGIKKKGPDIDVSAKYFAVQIVKIFLWLGIAFVVITILGLDVSGIAGITSAITVALGLALQDLIGGFASGLIILHQKHIATGDFISVQNTFGTCEGTVKKIHLFFTYLTTYTGQEVTVPNSNMAKAVVTNYTRSGKRRVDYSVGVAYNSDIEKAKEVLLNIVKDDPRVMPEECLEAYVYELGAYSVGLRLRFWTKFDDYWAVYNELSEKVLLAFRENGIYIPSSTDISVSNR